MVEPGDGERGHSHLLAMGGAGVGGSCKHVDPVGDLVLAHGAVMGDAGEADAETAQGEHAVEMAVGLDRMFGEIGGGLDHGGLVTRHERIGDARIEAVEEAVRGPPVDLGGGAAERIAESRQRKARWAHWRRP